jgi:hypothetical protein
MSNWEHKAADELENALVKHTQYARDDLTNIAHLIGIYIAAKWAVTVVETGSKPLIHIGASCAKRAGGIGYRPSIF